MEKTFYQQVIYFIKKIPKSKVATYGLIARLAGSPRAARQVSYILHSSSGKEKLPWFRVINSQGKISLRPGAGFETQKKLLEAEGIEFREDGSIDLKLFLWKNITIK